MILNVRNIFIDDEKVNNSEVISIEKGKVIIYPNRPLKKVILEFDFKIPGDALVLNDAFERAYGDLVWQKKEDKYYPWYIQIKAGQTYTAIGVKTGSNALCHWRIHENSISLIIDVRCGTGEVLLEEALVACEIVTLEETGDAFAASRKFCTMMCEKPIVPKEPIYGGNNWYYAYGNSSADQIIQDSKLIAKWSQGLSNRPFMVIDACWQPFMLNEESCSGGPYPYGNYLFPDMKKLAEDMKEIGVRPGLWYRPLKTAETVPNHWFIRDRILDPTVPEVYELLKNDAKRLSSWGYEILKHDFSTYDIFGLWGFEMENGISYKDEFSFYDRTKTTAMAIKLMYQAILEGADGSYIIGCNTVGHLAAGLTHIQRIGDDTSGLEWERTRKMGVNCLAFRAPQHNTFFSADADCVGITDKISWARNSEWLRLLANSGTPLFISADPKALNEQMESEIIEAFKTASQSLELAQPLDWAETMTPTIWKINTETKVFNWE